VPPALWGWSFIRLRVPSRMGLRLIAWIGASLLACGVFTFIAAPESWPLPTGLGGLIGAGFANLAILVAGDEPQPVTATLFAIIIAAPTLALFWVAMGLGKFTMPALPVGKVKRIAPGVKVVDDGDDIEPERSSFMDVMVGGLVHLGYSSAAAFRRARAHVKEKRQEKACWRISASRARSSTSAPARWSRSTNSSPRPASSRAASSAGRRHRPLDERDLGRVAVVPGRNAIGIELPNQSARPSICARCSASRISRRPKGKLPLCLGKTIGGEPVIADLAKHAAPADRRHHRLGQVGRHQHHDPVAALPMTPEQCRLIMIDPKMLELSVYDGIPHLLTPVVTDPKKAVVALKWAVREMEDRYRKMSKIGVRNIDGFNQRVGEAKAKGETITRTVQTGFDRETGEPIYESEELRSRAAALHRRHHRRDGRPDDGRRQGHRRRGPAPRADGARRRHPRHHGDAAPVGRRHHRHDQGQLPDPHLLPGDVEDRQPHHSRRAGRRAAARQGDMLYMAGGGRIRACTARSSPTTRSRRRRHLKSQGAPEYLDAITADEDEETRRRGDIPGDGAGNGSGDELYDKAVQVVLHDKKASTSYIQRRLAIGYNKAASLIERMEKEGVRRVATSAVMARVA
jgi:hypothetical protein